MNTPSGIIAGDRHTAFGLKTHAYEAKRRIRVHTTGRARTCRAGRGDASVPNFRAAAGVGPGDVRELVNHCDLRAQWGVSGEAYLEIVWHKVENLGRDIGGKTDPIPVI